MFLIPLLLAAQQTSQPADKPQSSIGTRSAIGGVAGPASPEEVRYHGCFQLATSDPQKAETRANQWRLDGGGFVAQQCLGVAYANQGKWQAAATEFVGAAQAAQAAQDDRAAVYWAEAGNARLAGGDAAGAKSALDAALAVGTLDDKQRAEAQLDRARASVATGDATQARTDLDKALATVPQDPLAWLLSATLARRTGDLARAHKDIAEAEKRAPDAAPVELEAGNIAAKSGDEEGAKTAWRRAVTLAPNTSAGHEAQQALQQFAAVPGTPPAAPQSR
ncbi:MAG: tetratricopeptide repeat protein [Sphingomonas sp.]